MSLSYYSYANIAPSTNEPVLIEINARMVPVLVSSLERYKYTPFWQTELDYKEGFIQLCLVQEALLTGAQGIVEAIDRLYRLMDTSLNGQEYTAAGIDPADITPAIPLVPDNAIGAAPGLRRQLEDARGLTPGGWFGIGARPVTYADLLLALRQGTEDEANSLIDRLDLLGDAGDLAGIFNVVRGTVLQGLETGATGGILATLVVSTLAQATMGGLAAQQMDTALARLERIIEQLGVAETPAPADTLAGELAEIRDLLSP